MKAELTNIAMVGSEVALAWSDGTETYVTLEKLREACPCAGCQGEPDALGRVVTPPRNYNERSFTLVRYETVGGYALQFFWADGHNTGIYSYPYLRGLGGS
ncbi:MAG: DUF971 domain-containing protein [Akkermansiaceae bacterium]|nr:DUF971 domain-containing protein [Akkermansiaceae bacterium]